MKVNKNTDIALIQVSGDDSADLLNNILTNDVSKVTNKNSIYSCLLSPQGKLIADLILCHFQESIILISHSGFAEDIIKTLNTYKLRSRVEINNVTNNFQYYYINYENLITSLNKNEVSDIYLTIFGLGIAIKIDERFISSKLKDCEEQIIYENAEKYYFEWLINIRDKAFIEIYYDKLI